MNAPVFAPDNETPEQLALRRKQNADMLRKLADDLENGRLPYVGFTFGRACDDAKCPDRVHYASLMYLEQENVTGFIQLRGMAAALSDACVSALQHRAAQRAMAAHQVAHAENEKAAGGVTLQ